MSDVSKTVMKESRNGIDGEGDRSSVEKQLAEKAESINRRIDQLEEEVVSTPAALKAAIMDHPFLGIAGAVAAGLVVSLLLVRRRKPDVAPFHQRLLEQYIDAVAEDVRFRMRRGRSLEEAVQEALHGRAPFIVYAPVRETAHRSRGFFKQAGDIILKTALGFTVKSALDLFSERIDIEEIRRLLDVQEETTKTGGEASGHHAGDGASGAFDQGPDAL